MPRIRKLAAVAAIAVVLAVGATAPSFAASPGAAPTLTITPSDPLTELPYLTFTGGCPAGSDAVEIIAPGGGAIIPVLDGAADFSTPGIGYFARNFGSPGTALTFTVTCSTAGVDSPPTSSTFTSPLYGSSVTVPVSVQTDAFFSISGTCGTAPGVSGITVRYYSTAAGGVLPITDFRALPGGGAFSFADLSTPTALGYTVGDSGGLNVFCETVVGGSTFSYTTAPSGTFTITAIPTPVSHAVLSAVVTVLTNENSPVDFAAECGPTTDRAELHWNGPSDSGFYNEGVDANQEFADTVDADQFGAPGETVQFTLECYAGATLVGSVVSSITLPNSASAVSMAASFMSSDPLVLSGTCGTTGATTVTVFWGATGGAPLHSTTLPITSPAWTLTTAPTPASLGMTAGTNGFAQAYCGSGGASVLSGRNTNFNIVAAPVIIASLARTGSDSAIPIAVGILLLIGGGFLSLRRRRAKAA